MISNQLLNSSLGNTVYMVHPRENRLFVFNAKYLHGVIPGVGTIPPFTSSEIDGRKGNADLLESRRLTLMVGFWRSLEAKDRGQDYIGAGQTFPTAHALKDPNSHTQFTWPDQMQLRPEWTTYVNDIRDHGIKESDAAHAIASGDIQYITPLWRPLTADSEKNDDYQTFFQGF
jgi:hypothetical protein